MRIGIIAAEPSGDQLAAGLMDALRGIYPGAVFEGIGGRRMQAVGMDCWEPMESLSVMGLVEVLRHLPRLLRLRRRVIARWLAEPPDVFIGVDAPDFNLRVEQRLRERAVPTVHYVCPTVWAWREKRVEKIRRAADLLLAIFPFEPDFLARHHVEAVYVGHPFAAEVPLDPDRDGARAALDIGPDTPVLALLPGSRSGEIGRIAPHFIAAARLLAERLPGLCCLVPMANARMRAQFLEHVGTHLEGLDLRVDVDATRRYLAACDVGLIASGTATLEAMLMKRPMVVGYRLNALTYRLLTLTRLRSRKYFAMANILDGEGLAPEFIQDACTGEALAEALLPMFRDRERIAHIQARYRELHAGMRLDTNRRAAAAVAGLLRGRADA